MKQVVIAGIGTGIGKTLISAILAEALEADYWKPVQAGNLEFTDTDFVKQHISNIRSVCHPEAYRLSQPMSPHAAAEIDGIEIELGKLSIPASSNRLIIEPAGGLMVPLNRKQLNIDLIQQWNVPVILVSQNYLGSINHTLLSVEVLKDYNITVLGIMFNGLTNSSTEDVILEYTGLPCITRIGEEREINKDMVRRYAAQIKELNLWSRA
jgi:dethiobiotin synthetase